jgi:hypothetical protein
VSLNHWTARFAKSWSDEEIDSIVEVYAVPLDVRTLSAEDLRNGFEQIFLSSAQTRGIFRQLIDIAFAHARSHFVSEEVFVRGLYEANPWRRDDAYAVCFSGLGGVGKTVLFIAFQKLLGASSSVDIPGHKSITLLPGWFLRLKDGADLNQLLRPYIMADESQNALEYDQTRQVKSIKESELLIIARRRSWRDGVCLIGIDEFQFITLGSEANAKATAVLLKFLGLGPQLIYVANYSLVHRLKKRGQEDRNRLLRRPIIMQPEACSSTDWIRLLTEFKKVCPDVLVFDVENSQELIHKYTFGIKRYVVWLLIAAFREARRGGILNCVGEDEIRRAYLSAEYSACREDVEILWRQQIEGRSLRQDLWCPFSDVHKTENVSVAQQAREDFKRRVDEDYLEASLMPHEAAALKAIQPESVEDKPPGKVVKLKKPKVTAESLLEGSRQFGKLPR